MDRNVRSLRLLEHSGSTARVLNLHRVWARGGPGLRTNPLFRDPVLNRAFILKHKLRRNEQDLFPDHRRTATKVMIPIDSKDLRLGAHSFFIGQRQLDFALEEFFGAGFNRSDDLRVLNIIDRLPTLDPFLMREALRREAYHPDRRYFDLSDPDLARMFSFVREEISQLVDISLNDESPSEAQVSRLVSKLLRSETGADMEPLRLTLRLRREEYAEGIFCWKGFLYYKWCLSTIVPDVATIMQQIAQVKPIGECDMDAKLYIERSRIALRRAIFHACNTSKKTLEIYDDAYRNLTQSGRPSAFREFLLEAPNLFATLGERLGAVSHIVSFWRYRFGSGAPQAVSYEELIDIFMDFATGLNCPGEDGAAQAA